MKSLKGKTALITGASTGIGEAFAHELASRGCNLIITARTTHRLEEIAAKVKALYKVKVTVFTADLFDPGAAHYIFDSCQKEGLQVDILVNNAGFGKFTDFLDETMQTYEEMMQINMVVLMQLSHLFLPQMLKKADGGIINIASTGAFQPCPFVALYCATKAFVLSFSEALYGEYINKGIVVTAVCPGNTQTDFFKVANAGTKDMRFDTTAKVAKEGVDAFLAKKNYKVIGFKNYLSSLSSRFFTRRMVLMSAAGMFKKRVKG